MIVFSINISLWSEGLILSNVWDSLTNDPWSVMSVVDTCVSSVTCLQCEERGHWWLRSRWQWWPVSVSAQSPLAAQVPHCDLHSPHHCRHHPGWSGMGRLTLGVQDPRQWEWSEERLEQESVWNNGHAGLVLLLERWDWWISFANSFNDSISSLHHASQWV